MAYPPHAGSLILGGSLTGHGLELHGGVHGLGVGWWHPQFRGFKGEDCCFNVFIGGFSNDAKELS